MAGLRSKIDDALCHNGTYFSILAATIFLAGTFTSMFLFKGYDITTQFFSELGVREYSINPNDRTIQYPRAGAPELFNWSLIIAGIVFTPYFYYVYLKVKIQETDPNSGTPSKAVSIFGSASVFAFVVIRENDLFEVPRIVLILVLILLIAAFALFAYVSSKDRTTASQVLMNVAVFSGVNTGPWLMLVGVFDLSTNWFAHVYVAVSLYFFILFTSVFWALFLLTAPKSHKYKSSPLWIWDIVFAGFIIFFTYINIVGNDNYEFIPIANLFLVQFFQKLMAYSFLTYYGLFVSLRIKSY